MKIPNDVTLAVVLLRNVLACRTPESTALKRNNRQVCPVKFLFNVEILSGTGDDASTKLFLWVDSRPLPPKSAPIIVTGRSNLVSKS